MTIYLSNALRQVKINLLGYHSNRSLTMFNATAKKTTSNVTIISFSYFAFRSYWLIRSREVFMRCSLRMYLSIVLLIVAEESAKDKDHCVSHKSLVTSFLSYWRRPMFEYRVFLHLSISVGLGQLGRCCDLLLALSEKEMKWCCWLELTNLIVVFLWEHEQTKRMYKASDLSIGTSR